MNLYIAQNVDREREREQEDGEKVNLVYDSRNSDYKVILHCDSGVRSRIRHF